MPNFIFSGPSGSGKSSIGQRFAAAYRYTYLEGDLLHPAASILKMNQHIPLDDADRKLQADDLVKFANTLNNSGNSNVVFAVSAIRREFRQRVINETKNPIFIYLHVSEATAVRRVENRVGHFFSGAGMVANQFEALEPPTKDEAIWIEADGPMWQVVLEVKYELMQRGIMPKTLLYYPLQLAAKIRKLFRQENGERA